MEIKFQNVFFTHNRNDKLILDGLNIRFTPKKVTGIIGQSGSGKSTLLDMIGGLKRPTRGKVIIKDIIISRKSTDSDLKEITKRVGYLPQDLENCFCMQTVRDDLNLYLDEIEAQTLETKIEEVFKLFNLDLALLEKDPFSLSNGELRQIILAFIIIKDPDIIILDEPIIGLNEVQKQAFVNFITRSKKMAPKTIILVSHDIDFIIRIADEIITLKEGKVIKSEKTSENFTDVKFYRENAIKIPQTVFFTDAVLKEKGIRLPYRSEINDLVKDILRNL